MEKNWKILGLLIGVLILAGVIGTAITGFVAKTQSSNTITCVDEEKEPGNIYERGKIVYTTVKNNFVYIDTCYKIFGVDFLREYSCTLNNNIKEGRHYCKYGCGNGACRKAP